MHRLCGWRYQKSSREQRITCKVGSLTSLTSGTDSSSEAEIVHAQEQAAAAENPLEGIMSALQQQPAAPPAAAPSGGEPAAAAPSREGEEGGFNPFALLVRVPLIWI